MKQTKRRANPRHDRFRIDLDKRWKLENLQEYSKNFDQAYFAYFAIRAIDRQSEQSDPYVLRVSNSLKSYPWKGGYSFVNFYNDLRVSLGRAERPEVVAIRYSSPGWMDLNVVQEVALSISAVVMTLCGSIAACNKIYNDIYKGMRERRLNEISVDRAQLDLEKEQLEFLRQSCSVMAETLHVPDVEKLHSMSGNELRTLKMLLSVFRRVRVLARYQNEGLARLPGGPEKQSLKEDG